MRRLLTGFFALGIIVVTASLTIAQAPPAGGQPPQQPPPLTNLQIYPKDIARPELIATMQGFVQAARRAESGRLQLLSCRHGAAVGLRLRREPEEERRAQDDPDVARDHREAARGHGQSRRPRSRRCAARRAIAACPFRK